MHRHSLILTVPLLLALAPVCTPPVLEAAGDTLVDQALSVRLDPATGVLEVDATLTNLPSAGPVEFLLNGGLEITSSTPAVDRVPLGDASPFFGNNGTSGQLDPGRVTRYRARGTLPDGRLSLRYRGA